MTPAATAVFRINTVPRMVNMLVVWPIRTAPPVAVAGCAARAGFVDGDVVARAMARLSEKRPPVMANEGAST